MPVDAKAGSWAARGHSDASSNNSSCWPVPGGGWYGQVPQSRRVPCEMYPWESRNGSSWPHYLRQTQTESLLLFCFLFLLNFRFLICEMGMNCSGGTFVMMPWLGSRVTGCPELQIQTGNVACPRTRSKCSWAHIPATSSGHGEGPAQSSPSCPQSEAAVNRPWCSPW